ncbi:hypothetical protein JL720_2808 [Aureococcus anophagefferens]|nr:hypothetical protein JL720_2808 [Aureococcus anophagefferens]
MTAVATSHVPSEKRSSPSRKIRPLQFLPVSTIQSPRKSPSPNEVQSFPDRRIHWNPDDDADDDVGLPLSPPNPPSMLPRAAAADAPTIPKLAPLTPPRSDKKSPGPPRGHAWTSPGRRTPVVDLKRSSIFEFRDNEDDEQIRSERSLRGNWSVEDDAWEDDAEEATFPFRSPTWTSRRPRRRRCSGRTTSRRTGSRCSRASPRRTTPSASRGHGPWARCFGFAAPS